MIFEKGKWRQVKAEGADKGIISYHALDVTAMAVLICSFHDGKAHDFEEPRCYIFGIPGKRHADEVHGWDHATKQSASIRDAIFGGTMEEWRRGVATERFAGA